LASNHRVQLILEEVGWGKTRYSPVTMNIIKIIGGLGSIDLRAQAVLSEI